MNAARVASTAWPAATDTQAIDPFEVFAIRIGSNAQRQARENFFFDACCGPPDASMPLDYYFWVLRSPSRVVVVDTCFPAETARRRERRMYWTPREALAVMGMNPASVADLVITHLHWDHAGCTDLFTQARLHVQAQEMQFCTGAAMRHRHLRKTYEACDVHAALDLLWSDRMVLHEGDTCLAPGLSLHCVGGHTPGSQVVRVLTRRGHLVLASDAVHLWANLRQRSPFPIVHDVARMLDGFERIEQLADGADHIIPGHDPLVAQRFPRWRGHEHIACLHEDPLDA